MFEITPSESLYSTTDILKPTWAFQDINNKGGAAVQKGLNAMHLRCVSAFYLNQALGCITITFASIVVAPEATDFC